MAGGDIFTSAQRVAVSNAIHRAELRSRMEISVFVGPSEGDDPRAFATQLHNSLIAPTRTIVVMVDPGKRALEIVTGGWCRSRISDDEVQATAETMKAAFAEGDLVGGLTDGIARLAEQAHAHATA